MRYPVVNDPEKKMEKNWTAFIFNWERPRCCCRMTNVPPGIYIEESRAMLVSSTRFQQQPPTMYNWLPTLAPSKWRLSSSCLFFLLPRSQDAPRVLCIMHNGLGLKKNTNFEFRPFVSFEANWKKHAKLLIEIWHNYLSYCKPPTVNVFVRISSDNETNESSCRVAKRVISCLGLFTKKAVSAFSKRTLLPRVKQTFFSLAQMGLPSKAGLAAAFLLVFRAQIQSWSDVAL